MKKNTVLLLSTMIVSFFMYTATIHAQSEVAQSAPTKCEDCACAKDCTGDPAQCESCSCAKECGKGCGKQHKGNKKKLKKNHKSCPYFKEHHESNEGTAKAE